MPKLARVWSRRWQVGRKVCEAHMADCFTMLVSTEIEAAKDMLVRSGTTNPPIFFSMHVDKEDQSAKRWGGYRVIWLGPSLEKTQASMNQLINHVGIVYRPPGSYGLRVHESGFVNAWQQLREGDAPAVVPCNHKFIIENVPIALDGSKLEQWSRSVKWPVRVLRKYHAGKYLVGAEDEPETQQMAINSKPILFTKVQENQREGNSIVAGRLRFEKPQGDSLDEDPLQVNDPWKANAMRKPSSTTVSGGQWEAYQKTTANIKTQLPGPTESMLKAQSDRITTLETDIQEIRSQMTKADASNKTQFTQLRGEINAMSTSLRSSLEAALQDQSSQLIRTFESLVKNNQVGSGLEKADGSRSRSPARANTHA